MERIGDYLETYTAARFYPLDPRENEIFIEDIARGLSNTCRFGGQSRFYYSVSQHCYYVSKLTRPENALFGLLHDAPEAYIQDIVSPLKRHLVEYKTIEENILLAVAKCFNFDIMEGARKNVKWADEVMLVTEAKYLMKSGGLTWSFPHKPLDIEFHPWSPEYSYFKFMERFNELTQKNGESHGI